MVRNQQTRIVDGLAKVMARKGYGATSVADVLAEAGVSRRTFYEHYRSKEDCFLKAFDAVAAGFAQRIEESYREPGDWPQRVTRALATLLDVLRREPELARMCMVESLSAGAPALGRYAVTLDRFERLFADAARRSPHGDRLPPHLPRVVVGGISSLVYRELADGGAERLPGLLPELVYTALVPYLGIDEALAAAEAAPSLTPPEPAAFQKQG